MLVIVGPKQSMTNNRTKNKDSVSEHKYGQPEIRLLNNRDHHKVKQKRRDREERQHEWKRKTEKGKERSRKTERN